MMRTRMHGGPAGGFTLIEVLIAAFVIGLGMLGLAALFAGAASQQRISAETSSSLLAARNAEAVILKSFGRIEGSGVTIVPPGVWFAMPAAEDEGYLSIDAFDGDSSVGSLYFVVDEFSPLTLYEREEEDATAAGRALISTSPSTISDYPVPFRDRLRWMPERRIHVLQPTSEEPSGFSSIPEIVVRFSVRSTGQAATMRLVFTPLDQSPPPWHPPIGDPLEPEYAAFTFGGNLLSSNYILLALENDPQGVRKARIDRMQIGLVEGNTDLWIDSIEIPRYSYRNDRLLSRSDRLVMRSDAEAPDGERPVIAFSGVFRRLETGGAQLALFSYLLEPTTRDLTFEPNESLSEIINAPYQGPLRLADVTLRFDAIAERYYFEADDANRWAVETGQLLLVQEGADPGFFGSGRVPGGDVEVRVTQLQRDGTRWRGWLNRSPTRCSSTMLTNRPEVRLAAWAVQPFVEAPDAEWRLTPLDVRFFQLD